MTIAAALCFSVSGCAQGYRPESTEPIRQSPYSALPGANQTFAGDIVVTVLGSGTPVPSASQFGAAILVEANGQQLLFDCGRGCTTRLAQVDPSLLKRVEHLFLTHLHSDHLAGIDDLWLNGWIQQRPNPLSVYGPRGSLNFMQALRQAYSYDIEHRRAAGVPKPGPGLDESVIEHHDKGGIVWQKHGITVEAFPVDHGPIKPAFGYKISYKTRSVVISGDTTYTETLERLGKDADVLLLEVLSPALIDFLNNELSPEQVRDVVSYHLTVDQAAQLFSAAKPRLGVYYHTKNDPESSDRLLFETRSKYDGPLAVSFDLMQIKIGEYVEVSDLSPQQ